MSYLLALDQGTSSSRSMVFDEAGAIVAVAQREFRQLFPQPGWIEHDPMEIWHSQLATSREVLHKAGLTASDLGAIGHAGEAESLAASVPDSGGVVFVPSFTGLGAPYWVPSAKGAILGLSRGSTVGHIAALEAIAFQSAALLQAMTRDAQAPITELRVDGGACANNLLLQFQADLLGMPVVRPQVIETTALGAAYLAGLAIGQYRGTDELAAQWRVERTFLPTIGRDQADERMRQWETAVRHTTERRE